MRSCWIASRFAGVLLVGSILLLCASAAQAWSYHSFAYGYSISLPDDWAHVPEEALAEQQNRLPRIGSFRGQPDAAFHARRDGAMSYPFLLIEVVPYSQFGFPQQLDDAEIRQIVQTNTGMDPLSPFEETQVVEGGAELEPMDGALSFDAEGRRFTWRSTETIENAGLLRTVQWGFFGKDMLVQVTLYERGKGSDRLRDMAEAIAGSFKFEIGKEYQPAFTVQDALKMAGNMVSAPNIGVLVTGGCVGTAILFAIIAMATKQRRSAACEQYSIFDRER